jgi:NAD(P)-dependent dehydrogenase (short-subunit alcohol dehydrogenase family)
MARLKGKVAVVTGGAGGIGQATARLFAAEGAQVLLVDLDEKLLGQVVTSIGIESISYMVADVTRPDQVEQYVQTAVERYGGIDVFINNAGIEGEVKPITEYSLEMFDRVMAVNVRGAWLGLKYVIPTMQKRGGGSIVITSSIAGIEGGPGISAYVMSKHAVVGMMRTAAHEYSSQYGEPWHDGNPHDAFAGATT